MVLGSPIIAEVRRARQRAPIARQYDRLELGSLRARGSEAERRGCCARELRGLRSACRSSHLPDGAAERYDCYTGTPINQPPVSDGRNGQETTGHGAATFSSPGASEMARVWNQSLSVSSRSSSTTNAGEDGAKAVLADLVGSQSPPLREDGIL